MSSVEKATDVAWTAEELRDDPDMVRLAREDQLIAAGNGGDVSGPYPGCMQLAGCGEEHANHRLVGQTRHSLVFAAQ